MSKFSAPWSVSLYLITCLSLAIILLAPAPLLRVHGAEPWIYVGIIVFLGFIARSAVILGYVVSPQGIVVRRFGKDVRISFEELKSLRIDPKAMNLTYAMLNGGLFSFGGKGCRNRRLGRYEAYATDRRRAVVLGLTRGIVVLTPEDPRAFVRAVRAAGWAAERR